VTDYYDFEPDFAGPVDFARYYRRIGFQVVPAHEPEPGAQWKRPVVPWRELENTLVSDDVFNGWYGPRGVHLKRMNLGLITGTSSLVWVLDLDTHKGPQAMQWWAGLLAVHNNGSDIETATQRTGGGGLQLLFRMPSTWLPPTCKTPIGIDIRGQGGFAVLAPSAHESGKFYEWISGREPWEVGVANTPDWLIDAVEALVAQYGGRPSTGLQSGSTGPVITTPTPEYATTPFGLIRDGREDLMTRMVWARIVDLRREAPIPITAEDAEIEMMDVFGAYLRKVVSRIENDPRPNDVLLEIEGRGISLMREKWATALSLWDTKVREHASVEAPRRVETFPGAQAYEYVTEDGEVMELPATPKTADDMFEVLDVRGIKTLPDPTWTIDKMLIDKSLSFVVGPPGCGKSFIVLNMGLSVASQREDFWGRTIKRTGAVIYISSEGVSDIKFRIMAWEQAASVRVDESPFYLIHQTINFMEPLDVQRLLKTVHHVHKISGEQIALVVVDTVSRVLPGADENLQKDMTLFIKACDAVREAFAATVIGVHHTSRAGNLRGSSVFDGAADSIFLIDRPVGEEIGLLKATKIKAAEDGWQQSFRLIKTSVGDIKGTESLYAKHTSEKPEEAGDQWPSRGICQDICAAIADAWTAGRPWSPYPNTKREGRFATANIMSGWDISKEMAERVIEAWLQNDVLEVAVADARTKLRGLRVKQGLSGWRPQSEENAFG